MKIKELFAKFYSNFFSYDVFISYTRADGSAYARKLYDQLTSLDYTCFIDHKEAPAGGALNSTLLSALKASKTLVLIGTEIALERKWVQLEFEEFVKTSRPIIPISIDNSLTTERLKISPWKVIKDRDLVWLDEKGSAVTNGLPSPEVYEGIQNYYKFTKRNVIRRRWVTAATLLILGAAIIAFFQAAEARAQRNKVLEQTKTLENNRDSLKKTNEILIAEQQRLKEKTTELQVSRDSLEIKTNEALENAQKAQEQEAIALENAKQAKIQQQLAEQRTLEAKEAQGTANVRWLVQLANSLGNKYPEQRALILLEALRRNNGRMANEAFLEQSLRTALETFHSSNPMRHAGLSAIAYSPDENWLATGSEDGSIWLWNIQTDESRKIVIGSHTKGIGRLEFSPNSQWLVSGCEEESYYANPKVDGKANIWHIGSDNVKPIVLEIPESGEPTDFHFSPNGDLLAVKFANEKVWLWRFDNKKGPYGEPIELLEGNLTARVIKFSNDGKWFITGNDDSSARVWNTGTILNGAKPFILSGHDDKIIRTADFSPDGQWLVTTSSDGKAPSVTSNTARLWKISLDALITNPIKLWIRSTFHPVRNVKFSSDSKWLAMQAEHADLRIWRLPRENENEISDFTLTGHRRDLTSIAFSPDNKKLATGSYDGMVKVWNLTSPNLQSGSNTFSEQKGIINDLIFTPNSQFLYSGSSDWTICMFDIKNTTQKPVVLNGLEGGSYSLHLSSEGSSLFSVSYGDKRTGFEGAEAVRRYRLSASQAPQSSETIAFVDKGGYSWKRSQDEKWFYSSTAYQEITLIGIDKNISSNIVHTIPGQFSNPCIDSKNKWLVSYKSDSLYFTRLSDLKIFTVKLSIVEQKYKSWDSFVRSVIFDQNGRWLSIWLANGEGKLYNLSFDVPKEIGTLKMPDSTLVPYDNYTTHKISFTPDGKWLLMVNSKVLDRQENNKIVSNAVLWNLSDSEEKINLYGIKLHVPSDIVHTGLLSNHHLIITTPNGSAAVWPLPYKQGKTPVLYKGGSKPFSNTYDYLVNGYSSPHGKWLVTFSEDSVFIWDMRKVTNGIPTAIIKSESSGVDGLDRAIFSDDENWLAIVHRHSWSENRPLRTVSLVNLTSHKISIRNLPYEKDNTYNIILFSKDGKWLATGGKGDLSRFSEETGIQLWDLSGNEWGKKSILLLAHNTSVDDFKFAKDSKNLFSTSLDRSIIKWDLNTSDPSQNFVFLKAPSERQFLSVTSLFPDNDGRTLYAATKLGDGIDSESTVIDKWLLTTESVSQEANKVIGRNLTLKEWRKFFGDLPYRKVFEELP